MNRAFSDIKTKEELKEYLCNYITEDSNGEKTIFSHYTKLESAIKIFKNCTLRFSKLSKMNDILEYDWANMAVQNEYYFCLAKGKESFGMWAMYGGLKSNSKEKYVKLEISQKSLAKFLRSTKNIYNLSSRKIIYTDLLANKDKEFFVPEKISISESTKTENKIEISKKDFAGFVKDSVWLYERELRLCVIPNAKNNSKDTSDIPLNEDFLKSIKIVPSPIAKFTKCRDEFCDRLDNSKYKDNFKENDFAKYFKQNSGFQRQLKTEL